MSTHLNAQQSRDWHDAVAAVEQVAANTDHESSSKQPMLSLVETVRTDPDAVLREIAWIQLEPMIQRIDPTTSKAMLAAVWDSPDGSLIQHP
jgi:hypothetical protein